MKGLIIVYTGNGKGKTTAALGLVLRAAGWGKRVLIIQFLKKQSTGEIKFIKSLQSTVYSLQLEQYGTKDFVDPKNLKPIDYEEAKKALASAMLHVTSSMFNVVILDEINVAIKFGLIAKEEVINLLKQKPKEMTLVLTGRWACPEIIERADLVTEFKAIKHPFKKGEKARKGIDF